MLNYKISFFIRKTTNTVDERIPIFYRLQIRKKLHEGTTGQFVVAKNWSESKERVAKGEDARVINDLLQIVRFELLRAITNLHLSQCDVTIENVKKVLKGETIVPTYCLIKVTIEHNRQFEKQVGIKYSWGSYKNYKTTLAFLMDFVQYQYQKRDIPLDKVNHSFCENYFVWLTTKKTSRQNGAAKHLQRLKKIVNYAVRMGYIQFNPMRSYTISMKPVARVALSWDEIMTISNISLPTGVLEDIRNVFIFQVFTGLPYSDIKVFSKRHLMKGIDGKFWIRMERSKTHNTFTVPLLPKALELLEIYLRIDAGLDEPIFPVLSNQKMNMHLKTIQRLAKIGKNLHTHLPRHTFASTVTLLNGVPLETVSKMLGHSKITMTQTYARVGELKISGDMLALEEKLSNKVQQPNLIK